MRCGTWIRVKTPSRHPEQESGAEIPEQARHCIFSSVPRHGNCTGRAFFRGKKMTDISTRSVTFVIPAYNEEESLPELHRQISESMEGCLAQSLAGDYSFLFIDDGSTDGTTKVIKDLAEKDQRIHYIVFRKNFGKAIALQTAFRNVDSDIIITMDADLQDDPVEIPNLLKKLDEGYDMVVGWKVNRLDPMEKKLPSRLFNRVTSLMSGIDLHDFDCGYKAMRREVAAGLDLYGQLHRYIPVLAYRKGFRITEIPVHHNKRKFGRSKYGMERYLEGLFDFLSVTFLSKFYDRPMYLFGRLGLISGIVGVIICTYLAVLWFMNNSIGTRPLLQLGVLLIILAAQFISIGFIGNLLLDATYRSNYNEAHIREKK